MTSKVIDISSNNHTNGEPIDWHQVRADGFSGVMIKCTEGEDYINPWLARDSAGAHKVNLSIGYYHFARPQVGNSVAQAEYAMAAIHNLPNQYGLALDLEVADYLTWDQLSTWAKNFLARISQEHIQSPFYSNENYLSHMPEAPFGHKLWYAHPSNTPPRRHCWMWQNSWATHVPGVPSQYTDINVYYGEKG